MDAPVPREPFSALDMAFLIDVSESMAHSLALIRASLEDIIDSLSASFSSGRMHLRDWRAKVAGFRDFEFPDTPPFVDNPFVRDPRYLKAQLATLETSGGRDEPECLLDALYLLTAAPEMPPNSSATDPWSWRHSSRARRFIAVFTDAPFKTQTFLPIAAGLGTADILKRLHDRQVKVCLVAPDIEAFRRLSQDPAVHHCPVPVGVRGSTAGFLDFARDSRATHGMVETILACMKAAVSNGSQPA